MTMTEQLPLRDLAACCSPVVGSPIDAATAEQAALALKAIADPARLRILSMVAAHIDREACVCDLTEPLGLQQSTVSHHLRILVDAGLLSREKRGTWAYYSLNPGALDSISGIVGNLGAPARGDA
ncbi:ArsR/SmtB family transcription factor [Microbacterium sp. CR_7]|uniref:ArsR/SmtB family transcription factor n=1 Tax=Microbacterium sp. CR_7 TaxID=3055792 RepID=UPI0035BF022B